MQAGDRAARPKPDVDWGEVAAEGVRRHREQLLERWVLVQQVVLAHVSHAAVALFIGSAPARRRHLVGGVRGDCARARK